MSDINLFLKKIADGANIKSITPKDKKDYMVKNCLNFCRKDIALNKNFAPILDELGFSISRHFLFQMLYIESAKYRLKTLDKEDNSYIDLKLFLEKGYIVYRNVLSSKKHQIVSEYFKDHPLSHSKSLDTLLFTKGDNPVQAIFREFFNSFW